MFPVKSVKFGVLVFALAFSVANADECEDQFTGDWLRHLDGLVWQISQKNCELTGNVESTGYDHQLDATIDKESGIAMASIFRRNKENGCVTELKARFLKVSSNQIKTEIYSSDGHCDLPQNFTENSKWLKQ